jgi:Resolvase, N terminal domain
MQNMSTRSLPVDAYVRVSHVGGREGESFISPDVQREKIEAFATTRGLRIGEVYVDLDQSGGKLDRPEFEKARLQALENHVLNQLIERDHVKGLWLSKTNWLTPSHQ